MPQFSKRKEALASFNTTNQTISKKAEVDNTEKKAVAVIYCRVSSAKQVSEGNGLESQERTCTEFCKSQNPPIEIDKIFIEPGVSGSKIDRKELLAMIAYIDKENKIHNRITNIVVTEASRISRPDDITKALSLEAQIEALGAKVLTVDNPNADYSTEEGKLLKTIQYAIAGYELKKIHKRTSEGKLNRLASGYRPFPHVPVGYIRERIGKKEYQDRIDLIKGPIIKKGLELYANDILLSDMDLRRYWCDEGLQTNAKNAKKLQRTFIEKTMQLHRIIFYAGYVCYPKWGINDLIEGKQEQLITLSTANKIIDKLQRKSKKTNSIQVQSLKMSDNHPLRGVISCPNCERKFTSWNTSKRIGKGEDKIKKLYPYYGCNNSNCDQKVNIAKDKLEKEFVEYLESIILPPVMFKYIKANFVKARDKKKINTKKLRKIKFGEIKKLKNKQIEIEETLMKVSNLKLYNRYQEQRAEIDVQIELMEKDLENEMPSDATREELFCNVMNLIEDPVALWKLGNQAMRELLIAVRFGNKLYYTKKEGLQTVGSGTLYTIFASLRDKFPFHRRPGIRTRDLGLKRPLL